jgi:soluble lytic murein transglycosylase-like protein
MVDGTKRIGSAVEFWHQAIPVRSVQQLPEEPFCNVGHIACDNQIPIGVGVQQGSIKATDGSATLDRIRDHREPETKVLFGRSDQGHRAGGIMDFSSYLFKHCRIPEAQQSLVAAHASAGSSGKNEARAGHEMILAALSRIVFLNKRVYICFLVALAMLAASPSRAAEVTTVVVRADARTGKLVRSIVKRASPAVGGPALNALVEKAAKAHDVDPLLVHSIISVESNYNTHAVSNKGAQGLMQLTPATAKMLGVNDSFDPQQNIEAGVKYLKQLKDLYKDDRLALAAYNAGPGAVDKYKKEVPPYAETQNYVHEVGKRYDNARRAADAAKPAEVIAAPEPKPVEIKPAKVETFIDENGRLHLTTTP